MKHFLLTAGLFFLLFASFSQTQYARHTVRSKETLYSISRDYGVTVNDLMNANAGMDANLKVGQVILIPKIQNEKNYVIFHVTSKTNLRKVANLYNVSVGLLQEENPDLSFRLYPGQKVKIPVGNKVFVPTEEEKAAKEEGQPKPEEEGVLSKTWCNRENPNTHKTFKVALMVPLYLEQADSLQKDLFLKTENDGFSPFRFLGFYEGALMAADSLKKQGMNLKLYVYDVDGNALKTMNVLQNPELKSMDLIIGPFLNKSFAQVARFAGYNNIPIVNPLSFREEITANYQTVIKVKPNDSYQNQQVADLIKNKFSDARVYLVKQSAYQDASNVQELQQILENTIPQYHNISNQEIYKLSKSIAKEQKLNYLPSVTVEGKTFDPIFLEGKLNDSTLFQNYLVSINYSTDSLRQFVNTAPILRNSLVIIYGDNKSFVMDVMNRLNELRDTFNIRIIGLPSWERFDNLDNNQCNDMNLIYLSSTFTNYDLPKVERFNYYFRQKYATEPGEYAFSGFDVTYFFLYALYHFDTHFSDCLENLQMNLFQSSYRYNRVGDSGNFENTYWNILEYKQFRLEKIPNSPRLN